MLADPQSITVNAVAKSLPRTSTSQDKAQYKMDNSDYTLTVSHEYKAKRIRRLIRLDARKIAADPLISAENILYTMGIYLVVDEPVTGYTVTEKKDAVIALADWLKASTNANTIAVMGGQS
jgi:hypothetical protein